MSEELASILAILSEKFGTTVEHLYAVMLHQAAINAGVIAVVWLVCLVSLGFVLSNVRKTLTKIESSDYEEDGLVMSVVLQLAGIGIFILTTLLGANHFVTLILNPEFWVIQQILGALK